VQHVHAGKACADHDDVVALGLGNGGWLADIDAFSRNCSDLRSSILSPAAKRKTQNRAVPACGMGACTYINGVRQLCLAFRVRMRQRSVQPTIKKH
jgi:hypothetical protein